MRSGGKDKREGSAHVQLKREGRRARGKNLNAEKNRPHATRSQMRQRENDGEEESDADGERRT